MARANARFHLLASIRGVINAIKSVNKKHEGICDPLVKEFVPNFVKLYNRVNKEVQDATSRSTLSVRFNMLSSKLDAMVAKLLRHAGRRSAQKQLGRAFASASPRQAAHGSGPGAAEDGSRYVAAA